MTRTREEIYDDLLKESAALFDLSNVLWGEVIDGEPSYNLTPPIDDIIDQLMDKIAPVYYELKKLEATEAEESRITSVYIIEYDGGDSGECYETYLGEAFNNGLTAMRHLYRRGWTHAGMNEEERIWLFTKGEGADRRCAYLTQMDVIY